MAFGSRQSVVGFPGKNSHFVNHLKGDCRKPKAFLNKANPAFVTQKNNPGFDYCSKMAYFVIYNLLSQ
jgi:hypothetical protein